MGEFFNKLGNALGGIFLGIVLFFVAIGVIFNNEGATNYREVAETAVSYEEATSPSDFVYVTGKVDSPEMLSDGTYLQEGEYLALDRSVEMFSWIESKRTETEGETEKTVYEYSQTWTSSPANSSNFNQPQGHRNPPLTINEVSKKVGEAKIGEFDVDMERIILPPSKSVTLTEDVLATTGTGYTLNEAYLFTGSGSLMAPQIGDVRIGFDAVQQGQTVTAYGRIVDNQLLPHNAGENAKLYRMFAGYAEDAGATMQGEYEFSLWLWRGLGFLLMWLSLTLVLKPIMVILDVVPVLGKFVNGALTFVTFIISLLVSVVVAIVGMVFHNIILLGLTALAVLVACYFIFFHKREKVEEKLHVKIQKGGKVLKDGESKK